MTLLWGEENPPILHMKSGSGHFTCRWSLHHIHRHLFPGVLVLLQGLDLQEQYNVSLRVAPVDNQRYRYINKKWCAIGASDIVQNGERQVYCHHSSPNTGHFWTQSPISFTSIKITHYTDSTHGDVSKPTYIIDSNGGGSHKGPDRVITLYFMNKQRISCCYLNWKEARQRFVLYYSEVCKPIKIYSLATHTIRRLNTYLYNGIAYQSGYHLFYSYRQKYRANGLYHVVVFFPDTTSHHA